MKKHLSSLILLVLLLAGLSLLLYPTVSDWWNSLHQSRAIDNYIEMVDEMDQEDSQRLMEEARAYNKKIALRGGSLSALSEAEREEYYNTFDITGTGIMGYLEIPNINVALPIYHGTEEAVLQIAIGHLESTSLPVGGENTHAALSGHRGLPSAKLFSDLDKLGEGDLFSIQVLGQRFSYMVDQIRIVLPSEVSTLKLDKDQDYITLITCTPYGVNTHRLLVRGHRVAVEQEAKMVNVVADATQINTVIVAICLGVPAVLIYTMGVFFGGPKRGRKQRLKDLKDQVSGR